MADSFLAGTVDAVNLLDKTRMALYREGHDANAVTAILYRAARKLDKEVKAALTGEVAL